MTNVPVSAPFVHPEGHVTVVRGSKAVLLLHGLSSAPAELRPVMTALAQAGYSVEAPVITGYSYTAGSSVSGSWQDWAQAALAWFDDMCSRYEQVAVGGLCIGAVLALHIAARRREQVAALGLMSTTLYYDGWGLPWLNRLRAIAYYTPLRHIWYFREREPFGVKNPQLRQWIAREMAARDSSMAGAAKLPMAGIYQAERLIRQVKRELPDICAPALILHAREDEVTSMRSPEYLCGHLGSREQRLVILENSYHMITIDNDRMRVNAEMVAFFGAHIRRHAASPLVAPGFDGQLALA